MADTSNKGNVRDKAQEAANAARQTAQEASHRAQETATGIGHRVQETAQTFGHRAQETASNLGNQAREFASSAGQKAEGAVSSVGESMSSLAGTIRERVPQEGMLGSAAGAVADRLQSSGQYLQQHDLGDITQDLGSMIRQHPVPAICIAFGLGWLLGMASRR
jgi:hypothetical protein